MPSLRQSLLLSVRDRVRAVAFASLGADQRARCCDLSFDGRPPPDTAVRTYVAVGYAGSAPADQPQSENRDLIYRVRLTITVTTSDVAGDQISRLQATPPTDTLWTTLEACIRAIDRQESVITGANTHYDSTGVIKPFRGESRMVFVGDSGVPVRTPADWFGSEDSETADIDGIYMTVDFDRARTVETPGDS